jgi:N-acetylglucosaminyldiphosphoundecaprenol N-acetyl-beta-D-mannosaminyltransferase
MRYQIDADAIEGASDSNRVSFCSMPFDMVDPADVLNRLTTRPPDRPFVYVATPNVDHVVRTLREENVLLPLYKDAWLTVCDSRVLAGLSNIAAGRLPVTTGADLTDTLLKTAITSADQINVIGADPDVIRRVREMYHLERINHYIPPMHLNAQPQEILKCVEFIERHPARFTFLAVGSPQQEKIAHGVWTRGKATGIGLCVGTALLFAVGATPRAPLWIQGLGLEWLHRLSQEPGRLARRYLIDDMQIFPIFSRHLLTTLATNGWRRRIR